MTWQKVKLGEVCTILSGFAFDSNHFNDKDGSPIIRIRDVTRGFSQTYYSGVFDERFVVSEGDILIGMDGEFNRAKWSNQRALLNQRVCKIESRGDLDRDYMFHSLPAALKEIEDATPFVTVKHLSVKGIQNIEISLPPLSEQKRLAAILDRADDLRRVRRQVLAGLDELAQSLFLELFGDPATNPKGWDVDTIKQIATSINYGTSQKSEAGGETPYLRMNNISYSGEWDFSDLKYITLSEKDKAKYLVKPGDILFNRTNSAELVGKTGVYRSAESMAFAGYLIRVRINEVKNPHRKRWGI